LSSSCDLLSAPGLTSWALAWVALLGLGLLLG
jgi:hypothetical protein